MTETVTFGSVAQAAHNIRGKLVATPCMYSKTLSEITGANVWVKYENQQFTAAFKERGALNRLMQMTDDEKARGVVAMSAGNHAQGVAYNAARLGIPATIVMPRTTPYVKVKYTEKHGATVVLHGETLLEADAEARRIEKEEGKVFVHPYDDPLVIAGQGTVAMEMLDQAPEIDCLVIPLGGGGLTAGCAVAAKGIKPDLDIYGVETELYPAMHQVLRGEEPKVGGATIAEGIAVKQVGDITRKICEELVKDVLVVRETSIERAINLFLNVEKTLAEGAGAAGLAAMLEQPELFKGRNVGVILSGGNIDPTVLATVVNRGLVAEGRLAKLRLTLSDKPGQLALVSETIGEAGGNIVEVQHQRLFGDMSVKSASLDVMLEARDHAHVEEIVDVLVKAGFPTRQFGLLASDS